jgi:putative ubiquitin-RnfH superfamily antitoxin RatB of RatAB toxin-antitoxin module
MIGPVKEGFTVPTVRLDEEFDNATQTVSPIVDFIKIDTEGAEVQVLAGAGKIFDHPVKYLIECHTDESLELIRKLLTDGREERYSTAKFLTNL